MDQDKAPETDLTKKSIEDGNKIKEIGKKVSGDDHPEDKDEKEKKDAENWRNEG